MSWCAVKPCSRQEPVDSSAAFTFCLSCTNFVFIPSFREVAQAGRSNECPISAALLARQNLLELPMDAFMPFSPQICLFFPCYQGTQAARTGRLKTLLKSRTCWEICSRFCAFSFSPEHKKGPKIFIIQHFCLGFHFHPSPLSGSRPGSLRYKASFNWRKYMAMAAFMCWNFLVDHRGISKQGGGGQLNVTSHNPYLPYVPATCGNLSQVVLFDSRTYRSGRVAEPTRMVILRSLALYL